MTAGKLRYLLAELATLPAAAVVVEDRYSAVFKLDRVRPAMIAEGLGEAAARFPSVPIVFAETRPLAQEWTYRFLGAALVHHHDDAAATDLAAELPAAGPVPPPEPTTAEVRAWARHQGLTVADRDGCIRTSGTPIENETVASHRRPTARLSTDRTRVRGARRRRGRRMRTDDATTGTLAGAASGGRADSGHRASPRALRSGCRAVSTRPRRGGRPRQWGAGNCSRTAQATEPNNFCRLLAPAVSGAVNRRSLTRTGRIIARRKRTEVWGGVVRGGAGRSA